MTELIHNLALGFSVALTPQTLLAALIGVVLGTMVGVLPGLGPVPAMAILLPVTMAFTSPTTAVVLLAGIFYGSQYGDSMAAILVNVPSEAPAIVIARDGYRLTRSGRAGAALAVAGVASFIGAVTGLVGVGVVSIPLSHLAVYFRPSDYAALAALGLLLLPLVMGQSLARSIVGVGFGLALTTVGTDPITSLPRFTFGSLQLSQGIDLVPIAVGMFGMAEVLGHVIDRKGWPSPRPVRFRELLPTKREWRWALPAAIRGSLLGFILGALPGPSLILASFSSHALERRLLTREERRRDHLGNVRGIAGPKAADDSAVGGNLVPLLTLGIPFTPVTAMLLAGFTLHQVQPGPEFVTESPDIFWGLLVSMLIGNVLLLVLNFPFAGIWVHLLRVPASIRSSVLIAFMVVGSYAVRDSMFDVVVLFIAGGLGYLFKLVGLNRALVVLGVVLGPFLETAIRQSLAESGGDPWVFVDRPVGMTASAIIVVAFVLVPVVRVAMRRARHARAGAPAAS